MGSPPPNNLQGASRVTGGVICGHALGNVSNLADSSDLEVPILHTDLLKLGEKHSPVHCKLAYYQLAIYF